MNWKKKMQGFFTLNRHAEGFTLVELIVVIAILAILAGVAVPAYSGYVAKANEAADQQLLGAVNTAFVAACITKGVDHYNAGANDPKIEGGKLGEITVSGVADFNAVFETFYDADSEFKVMTGLYYNRATGGFAENKEITYKDANGVTYTASASDIAKYKETTWFKYLESEDLLQLVDAVVGDVQGGKTTDEFEALIESPAYKSAAAELLGISVDKYDEHIADMKNKLLMQYVAEGLDPEAAYAKASGQVDGNLAALVASKRAQEAGNSVIGILTENNGQGATTRLDNNLSNDATLGFSQTALAYGLYTSYIYSKDDLTLEQKKEQSTAEKALSGGFESAGFQNYLKNDPQAMKDLEGLLSALNVAGSQNKDTASSVVTGGFVSDEMIGAMNGILGG